MSIFTIIVLLLLLGILSGSRSYRLGNIIKICIMIMLVIAFAPFLIIFLIIFILYFVFGGKIKTNYTYYSNEDWEKFKNSYNSNYRTYNGNQNYDSNMFSNSQKEYEDACVVIGVDPNDSFEVKKKKRNTLLKKYHPDFYQDENEKKKATEFTNKINSAWDIIEKHHGFK